MISIKGPTHFPPSFPPQGTLRTVEPRKVRSSQSMSSLRAPSVWTTRMSSLRSATRQTDQTLPHLKKKTSDPCTTIRLACFEQGKWTKIFLCVRHCGTPTLPQKNKHPCWPRVKSCQSVTSWCFRILCPSHVFIRTKKNKQNKQTKTTHTKKTTTFRTS